MNKLGQILLFFLLLFAVSHAAEAKDIKGEGKFTYLGSAIVYVT